MSTPDAKPAETPATPAAAPKKSSAMGGIVKLVIPALLAAGAAYGGTRAAAAHTTTVVVPAPEHEETRHHEPKPPGPTVTLEPFLVTITDTKGKGHAMKLTIAIEFEKPEKGGGGEEGKEGDALKPFAPRIRDGILSYVRTMSYEDASDGTHMEKVRTEMLERCHGAGAVDAVRVLITDFVIQ